ncbi:hypothetical protein BJX61DRAFT_541786 [Aspergillus egyptiacus]|nr:hypothetical protein BJX61DRAFT_541786 [Aspergillus egyptiacus]
MATTTNTEDREAAARTVIQIISRNEELCTTRVAVIGSLAIQRYLPTASVTHELLEIFVDGTRNHPASGPDTFKNAVLEDTKDGIKFSPGPKNKLIVARTGVKVQFCYRKTIHFTPTSAMPASLAASRPELPYASPTDLLVISLVSLKKVEAQEIPQALQDADNANKLASKLKQNEEGTSRRRPHIVLTREQFAAFHATLTDSVERYTDMTAQDWRLTFICE